MWCAAVELGGLARTHDEVVAPEPHAKEPVEDAEPLVAGVRAQMRLGVASGDGQLVGARLGLPPRQRDENPALAPVRLALIAPQGVFALSIAAGLLGNYQVLLVSRAVAGIAYAGFFAVASVTAIGLVTPERNARASGVVVSGLSVAMVAGGPAETLLGHFTDWRGGFWAVVVLTAAGMHGCLLGLPPPCSSWATQPSAAIPFILADRSRR